MINKIIKYLVSCFNGKEKILPVKGEIWIKIDRQDPFKDHRRLVIEVKNDFVLYSYYRNGKPSDSKDTLEMEWFLKWYEKEEEN